MREPPKQHLPHPIRNPSKRVTAHSLVPSQQGIHDEQVDLDPSPGSPTLELTQQISTRDMVPRSHPTTISTPPDSAHPGYRITPSHGLACAPVGATSASSSTRRTAEFRAVHSLSILPASLAIGEVGSDGSNCLPFPSSTPTTHEVVRLGACSILLCTGDGRRVMTEDNGDVRRFEELLTPEGRELLERLDREVSTEDSPLRLGAILRVDYPVDLVAAALTQHELRRRAGGKFSRAGKMFFTRAGLEQASSETVGRHRAARYAEAGLVADLCCGIGGDLVSLAANGPVLAVDLDPLHLSIAQLNAEAYGVADQVSTRQSDVREVDLSGVDGVFIDPARRSGGRRKRTGDSEPPLEWCWGVSDQVRKVGVKAAPGLPHEDVPPGWEIEFIALGKELKEAVAWSPALATATRRATLLPDGHSLTPSPGPEVPVREPGEFLCDPNPAVTRAGLVEELARDLDAWKIDPQIAFLSADRPLTTPFGRGLRIIDSGPWNQKHLPAKLRELDIGAVDIRRRGLAGDVDKLHRQLKLSGSRRATLVMTRVKDRPWGLVCLDE
ncbi:THUMP-like domain-containing protein [Actinokineospora sp. G85]|uniref:class I SAM-dependent methyltransferase n=1 Tax=Actinokineospora sp. G85 TaxID=3406626 RepID=UPI003C74873D